MSPLLLILYEDKRGPEKEFGLHNFVLACIADELGADVYTLKLHQKISGRPMKGVNKVLASCRKDIHRLGPQGQPVFALIDDDVIREHLRHEGVAADAEDRVVIEAIKAKCVAPDKLEVILLKDNTETVIEAAGRCDGSIPKAAVQQALQKDPMARDRVLNRLAWAHGRAERDCVRAAVPALQSLVERVVQRIIMSDVRDP